MVNAFFVQIILFKSLKINVLIFSTILGLVFFLDIGALILK
jgi:hypothetical protein